MKAYRQRPERFTGRPKMPGYARSKGKEVVFSNQDCVIKEGKYLKLPRTKRRLNIGKLSSTNGKLKQVRVVPRHGQYVVELIFARPLNEPKPVTDVAPPAGCMAIDLGVNNLATLVTTTGAQPMLVKGGIVKAINQYYNKMRAHYTSILREGKDPREGPHTSKRLERLHLQRHRRIKDLFHKVSHHLVRLAVQAGIDTLVIGHNPGWKQGTAMGRRNNQSFCHLPHGLLIGMIRYKAAEQGITVILTEEAYTSKASFLDHDPLPCFDETVTTCTFSGKRIHRGLYVSPLGRIHADVNGAANILRKVFPNVRAKRRDGIEELDGNQSVNVSTPQVLSILRTSG